MVCPFPCSLVSRHRNATLESQIRKLRKRPLVTVPESPQSPANDENRPDPLIKPPTSTLGSLMSPRKAAFDVGDEEADQRELKQQIDTLTDELSIARASLTSSERLIREQKFEIKRLKVTESEHLDIVDQFEELKHKCRSMKQDLRDERERRKREEQRAVQSESRAMIMEDELRIKEQETQIEASTLRDEFNVRMTDLRDALGREQSLKSMFESAQKTLASERTTHQHNLQQEKARCKDLERQRKQLEDRCDALQLVNARLVTQIETVQAGVSGSEGMKQRLRAANEQAKTASNRARELQDKLEKERTHRIQVETILNQQADLFEALRQEAEQLKKEYNDVQNESQTLKERIKGLNEVHKTMMQRERELGAKVESQVAEKTRVEMELRASNEKLGNMMNESDHLKSELERSMDNSQIEVERIRIELEDLRDGRSELQQQVSTLEGERDTHLSTIATLNERIKTLEASVRELESETDGKGGKVDELELALEKAKREEKVLKKNLEEGEGDLRAAHDDVVHLKGEMARLRESHLAALNRAVAEKDEVERAHDSLVEQCASLEEENSDLRGQLEHMEERVDFLMTKCSTAEAQVEALKYQLSTAQRRKSLTRENTDAQLHADGRTDEVLRDALDIQAKGSVVEEEEPPSQQAGSNDLALEGRDSPQPQSSTLLDNADPDQEGSESSSSEQLYKSEKTQEGSH